MLLIKNIMPTTNVYHIQRENRKTPQAVGSFSVCYTYQYFSADVREHLE